MGQALMLAVIMLFSALDCVRASAMWAAISRTPAMLEAIRWMIGEDVELEFLVRVAEVASLATLIFGYLGVQAVWSANIGPLP